MSTVDDVLAFDWGTTIVGILDINADVYTPYRSPEGMLEGAKRIVSAAGTIVSFNGNACDLPKLFELLRLEPNERVIRATHDDMIKIPSDMRWPPDRGTGSIAGPGLRATYEYYFGDSMVSPPDGLRDEYEVGNWTDCYMTAALWKKRKRGELGP